SEWCRRRMTAAASLGMTMVGVCVLTTGSGPAEPFAVTTCPGIAPHVIAASFPVASFVLGEEAHAFDPFCRFPSVELRHDQTHGSTVLWWYRCSVMGPRKQRIFIQEKLDRNVGRPATVV